jgi:hypothetical protein
MAEQAAPPAGRDERRGRVITVALPDWLTQEAPGFYAVDPEIVYPLVLRELKVDRPTQYWLEVAYLLVREAVQRIVPGHLAQLRFLKRPKWALAAHPPHEGCEIVGAAEEPALRKLETEVNSHQARKDWRRYERVVARLARPAAQ